MVYDERTGWRPVIDRLRERAEEAQERYERERARLFRPDGSKRYSDEEHAEREAARRRERDEVLRKVEAEAIEDKAITEGGETWNAI